MPCDLTPIQQRDRIERERSRYIIELSGGDTSLPFLQRSKAREWNPTPPRQLLEPALFALPDGPNDGAYTFDHTEFVSHCPGFPNVPNGPSNSRTPPRPSSA